MSASVSTGTGLIARVPGSKSITNRALLLAAAARGTSVLRAPLISDDTLAFRAALTELGVRIRGQAEGDGASNGGASNDGASNDGASNDGASNGGVENDGAEGGGAENGGAENGGAGGGGAENGGEWTGSWVIDGLGGGPRATAGPARIWCADAGTAARFLPPFAAAGRGEFVFDGSAQLRARPLRPLLDALRKLGATITAPGDAPAPEPTRSGGDLRLEAPRSGGDLPPGHAPTGGGLPPEPAPSGRGLRPEPVPSGGGLRPEPVPSGGGLPPEPAPSGGGLSTEPAPTGEGLPLGLVAAGIAGGAIELDGSLSSQYLSGLLLAAPLAREPLVLRPQRLVSRPYVDMTRALMRRFGADCEDGPDGALVVRPGGYRAVDLTIEPDASTASYFFAAAAVTGSAVTVPGLGAGSLQGDLRFVEVLRLLGARVEIGAGATTVTGTGGLRGGLDLDMGEISDTFMTLAAIAPLADAPITVRGIGHARLKESDRIAAVSAALGALGIRTTEGPDHVTVHPGPLRPGRVACRRDHRIAMSFSVLGLAVPGTVTLDDPQCVSKTFPGFHRELRRLFAWHAMDGEETR